ncbi:MAG: hypothetical protein Q4P84_05530 [Elusimicrobiales bacterium]|nr:hypothetical protein [Elusimicrobiales bacterium]
MISVIVILFFVVLLAVPGFYIITRKVFPQGSKKSALTLAILLTVLLIGILVAVPAFPPAG